MKLRTKMKLSDMIVVAQMHLDAKNTIPPETLNVLYLATRQEVMARMFRYGMSLTDIAEDFTIDRFGIEDILRENGVYVHPFGGHAKQYVAITLAYLQGSATKDLAAEYGLERVKVTNAITEVCRCAWTGLSTEQQADIEAPWGVTVIKEYKDKWLPIIEAIDATLPDLPPPPPKTKMNYRERDLVILERILQKPSDIWRIQDEYRMSRSNVKRLCTALLREMVYALPKGHEYRNGVTVNGTLYDLTCNEDLCKFWLSQLPMLKARDPNEPRDIRI